MATSNRRQLFVRSTPEHPMTAYKARVLAVVAHLELATVPQVSAFLGSSERAVRAHAADLFHMGLLDRIGVPRAALADTATDKDDALLFGRAPTVHALTRAGAKFLEVPYTPCTFSARNTLFLSHEIGVRDFRVWLEVLSRHYGHHVTRWDTHCRLGPARPDAVGVYELGRARMVICLEVDRSTESLKHIEDKHTGYRRAFESGILEQQLGHSRARVVLVTPDAKRREAIAAVLAGRGFEDRFWIAERSVLARGDLSEAVWRVPGTDLLLPLVSKRLLEAPPLAAPFANTDVR